ncbi:MAG TPA: FHA domain-containing protein [Polyangia bacterium]|nr:FHA domain-containing protein [Polyangia bacterium]
MPLRLRLLASAAAGPGAPVGPSQERAVELPDDTTEIRIGRRTDIEVPLPYPSLSGLHARLFRSDGGWQLEDLGSTNGTRLDGEPLAPRSPRAVRPGAQIAVGPVLMVFDGPAPPSRGSERTASIARRLVNDILAASPDAGAPALALVEGVPPGPPLRLVAFDRRYVIGRGETCDMRLVSEEVSREHAAIVRRWDGVFVQDLGSKNGISVNEQTVGEVRVRDGDLVRIGPAVLRLSDPADRYLREIEAPGADELRPRIVTFRDEPPRQVRPAQKSNTLRAAMAVAMGVLVIVVAAGLILVLGR